ncbi:MAG: cellulase family glycosylhydrolase [Sphingobium sp.]|uniref:cellulase family glycosylhydrolase n=1 Tax=Sphingobium sp. TaxID=1912891 RepID=UPI0029A83F0C|nr:cellulase family glycosylhydrolase [Sphingobium sp.]MDX3909774.1 cellulase family glycosylhydrolase [Sphingobium sp.]
MGVNLSGCEFASDGALCPSPATVNTYIDKGFRAIRLPFRGTQASNPVVVSKMKAAVDAAIKRGVYVILDRHDYGNTFDPKEAGWWGSFIKNFPNTTYVMIDTMNEPRKGASYQADPSTRRSYATEVNAGISAFRKAGYKHKLLIEWRGSSGMVRFDKREASNVACESPACSFDRAGGLKDPLGLTMVSGHRYPDSDGSGTSPVCVPNTTGTKLIWNTDLAAKARGLKVWVGEFAFGNHIKVDPICDALGKDALKRMRSLPETYVGVTWWGGGNGWKEDYLYKIEPRKGTFGTAAPSAYLTTITGR